jgi:hypothetical protein
MAEASKWTGRDHKTVCGWRQWSIIHNSYWISERVYDAVKHQSTSAVVELVTRSPLRPACRALLIEIWTVYWRPFLRIIHLCKLALYSTCTGLYPVPGNIETFRRMSRAAGAERRDDWSRSAAGFVTASSSLWLHTDTAPLPHQQ